MKFEEEFPSLKDKVKRVQMSKDDYGSDVIPALDVQRFCLDKMIVNAKLDKIFIVDFTPLAIKEMAKSNDACRLYLSREFVKLIKKELLGL